MAEVYVSATGYDNIPIMVCDCGHRRPGGMTTVDEWFEHEQSHVTATHPRLGQLSSVTSMGNPAILPPLISRFRYLS